MSNRVKNLLLFIFMCVFLLGILVFAVFITRNKDKDAKIYVYFDDEFKGMQEIYDMFTTKTGIIVEQRKVKEDQLFDAILKKQRIGKLDMIGVSDISKLRLLLKHTVFDHLKNTTVKTQIDSTQQSQFIDPNNYWVALTAQTKVFVYNRFNPIQNDEYINTIHTYLDLFERDPPFEILIPRHKNSKGMSSFVAYLLAKYGKEQVYSWMRKSTNAMPRVPKGDDLIQIREVRDRADLALVDVASISDMLFAFDEYDRNAAESLGIVLIRPMFFYLSGIAVMNNAHNKEDAYTFMSFLLGREVQQILSKTHFSYPTVKGTTINSFLATWGMMPPLGLDNVNTYLKLIPQAIDLIEEFEW